MALFEGRGGKVCTHIASQDVKAEIALKSLSKMLIAWIRELEF